MNKCVSAITLIIHTITSNEYHNVRNLLLFLMLRLPDLPCWTLDVSQTDPRLYCWSCWSWSDENSQSYPQTYPHNRTRWRLKWSWKMVNLLLALFSNEHYFHCTLHCAHIVQPKWHTHLLRVTLIPHLGPLSLPAEDLVPDISKHQSPRPTSAPSVVSASRWERCAENNERKKNIIMY